MVTNLHIAIAFLLDVVGAHYFMEQKAGHQGSRSMLTGRLKHRKCYLTCRRA